MMHGQWNTHPVSPNGHKRTILPTRKWRYTLKDVAVIWFIAITVSWLIGLGVVKLVDIVEGFLRGLQ